MMFLFPSVPVDQVSEKNESPSQDSDKNQFTPGVVSVDGSSQLPYSLGNLVPRIEESESFRAMAWHCDHPALRDVCL